MAIKPRYIKHIEKALGFKLYQDQIDYLLGSDYLTGGRRTGKTTVYCIKLALSEGDPLNLNRPWEFSDRQYLDVNHRYSTNFFRKEFLRIRELLENYGFKVREVIK